MEKMKMQSPDLTARNIEMLKSLFPSVVTETRGADGQLKQAVDFDALQLLLGKNLADSPEAYRFTWVGKRAAMAEAARPIRKTLRPLTPPSKDWDHTENLYIEGDNLDALKLLQESYLGKVKMIYIDPPYNTGHDFIYKDKFRMNEEDYDAQTELFDEEGNKQFAENNDSNPRFHSDWCSMMYPRLLLARNLLTDDGVIFISIDDNEQATLKNICNEIFGEMNFIIQIAWRRTDNQPNIGNIARVKEYILCYAKNIKQLAFGRLPLTERAKKEYRYKDENGQFRRAILLDKTRGRYYYDVKTKSGHIINGPWMVQEADFKRLEEQGLIYWATKSTELPYGKIYLDESKGQVPNDFWGIEFGTNQQASAELDKLFGYRIFDFPKPSSLLKTLVSMGSTKNNIILDFFSGSATTANAVMELNAEDGGHRKFIMVQAPEPCAEKSEAYKAGYRTICDIGEERIRRVSEKIQHEHPGAELDTGFRVFRVDSTNMEDVYYSAGDYSQALLAGLVSNVKPDRSALDLFFGCILDAGLPLDRPYAAERIEGCTVHDYGGGLLLACFDEAVPEAVIRAMAARHPLHAVFRDSSFADSAARINADEIFKSASTGGSHKETAIHIL